MTRPISATALRRTCLSLVASALLALPVAHASSAFAVDASAAPLAAGVAAFGVDLAWDGGLVLVLSEAGTGALGDMALSDHATDALPTDALGRILTGDAPRIVAPGLVEPGGFTFVQDASHVEDVVQAYAARLTELGFTVRRHAGERTFTFANGEVAYRAVFGAVDGGVQVFLGL